MLPHVMQAHRKLTDTLRFVGLSAIPFQPSLLGTPQLCFRLLPEPHHPAVRDPRVAPPDRGSAALRQTSETHLGGSLLLGLVMHGVEGLAFQCFPRPTRRSSAGIGKASGC